MTMLTGSSALIAELKAKDERIAELERAGRAEEIRADRAEFRLDSFREALSKLVDAHAGYQHGVGPCICAAHENARSLLASVVEERGPKPCTGCNGMGDVRVNDQHGDEWETCLSCHGTGQQIPSMGMDVENQFPKEKNQ